VPWAGGQGLARFLLDRPETVQGRRVLDFGTGSGLVAIAAAIAGAGSVRAVDVDPLAAAASALNAEANGVEGRIAIEITSENELDAGDAEIVLAGDVWYERAPAARFAAWLRELARRGVTVLTGDPGRAYVPAAVHELVRYQVPTTLELESAPARVTRVLEIG
jgi:predicted nicotinamide N-methyase